MKPTLNQLKITLSSVGSDVWMMTDRCAVCSVQLGHRIGPGCDVLMSIDSFATLAERDGWIFTDDLVLCGDCAEEYDDGN